jgi:hypothetical protein
MEIALSADNKLVLPGDKKALTLRAKKPGKTPIQKKKKSDWGVAYARWGAACA